MYFTPDSIKIFLWSKYKFLKEKQLLGQEPAETIISQAANPGKSLLEKLMKTKNIQDIMEIWDFLSLTVFSLMERKSNKSEENMITLQPYNNIYQIY